VGRQSWNSATRANEWHIEAAERAVAPTTEQVQQGVGANGNGSSINDHVLQLDLVQ
jgi:hypothetical protein